MTAGQIPAPRDENGKYVSLRDYIEAIMDERQQAHRAEHSLIDKALDKAQELREDALRQARAVIDQRLEKLNELRAEVQEDRGSYLTKSVFDSFKEEQARVRRSNLVTLATFAIAIAALAVQVLTK